MFLPTIKTLCLMYSSQPIKITPIQSICFQALKILHFSLDCKKYKICNIQHRLKTFRNCPILVTGYLKIQVPARGTCSEYPTLLKEKLKTYQTAHYTVSLINDMKI